MTTTASKVVATGRLVRLREKRVEDVQQDYEWRRDPELAAYDAAQPLSMSYDAFVSTVRAELESPASHRRSYAIEEMDEGKHIGNVMYYGYDPEAREAELGVTIGDRAYWSQGYGSDAIRAVLGYLFQELGLRRVYLHTLTWNDRAQHAFSRAGFRVVREVKRGSYDFVLMEILRDEFAEQERRRMRAGVDAEG